ncbi:hypothetical protein B0A55_01423 [Friedmanniomyces simplex]|uniref:CCHC-type domain-containing protein n=1 Tax=Friedmanniomyces simplex TaxID=329884 RepID=A0A4U0XX83_9PEZI|nr:hypothetical protein B0A55_01423 [Friedmanniomyces simplex]
MSNLCHNCSYVHFPEPCEHPPAYCEICKNWGHLRAFCPTGAVRTDPIREYWLLCHNCETWHLPSRSTVPLQRCSKCSNLGHKEVLCPAAPEIGPHLARFMENQYGVATSSTDTGNVPSGINFGEGAAMTQDNVRRIRVAAAKEVFELERQGIFDEGYILREIATPTASNTLGSNVNGPIWRPNGSDPFTVGPGTEAPPSLLYGSGPESPRHGEDSRSRNGGGGTVRRE